MIILHVHTHTYRKTGQRNAIRTPKRRDHHILCNETKKVENQERKKDMRRQRRTGEIEKENPKLLLEGDEKEESTWSGRKPQLKSVTRRDRERKMERTKNMKKWRIQAFVSLLCEYFFFLFIFILRVQSLPIYTYFYNSRRDFGAPIPSAATAVAAAASATTATFSSRLLSSAPASSFFLATAVFLM